MKKRNTFLVIAAFLFSFSIPLMSSAQEEEEDEKKMIREVIDVQVDKPVVVAPTPTVDPADHKKKKKNYEEPPPEEVMPDTGSSTIPAPVEELKKRGTAWMGKKEKTFAKVDPVAAGSTLECLVSFIYKPKELNPLAPVEGKITMKVVIDCKEGKYRYTIKDIKHVANRAEFSGGDIYEDVAACGSMALPEPQWKRIKSFSIQKANEVAFNLKETMKHPAKHGKKNDW
jgi:hypothetical protein